MGRPKIGVGIWGPGIHARQNVNAGATPPAAPEALITKPGGINITTKGGVSITTKN
jgi:hypothetical protein